MTKYSNLYNRTTPEVYWLIFWCTSLFSWKFWTFPFEVCGKPQQCLPEPISVSRIDIYFNLYTLSKHFLHFYLFPFKSFFHLYIFWLYFSFLYCASRYTIDLHSESSELIIAFSQNCHVEISNGIKVIIKIDNWKKKFEKLKI